MYCDFPDFWTQKWTLVLNESFEGANQDLREWSFPFASPTWKSSCKFVCDSAVGSNDLMLPGGEHDYLLSPWSPVMMAAASEELILWLGCRLSFFFPSENQYLELACLKKSLQLFLGQFALRLYKSLAYLPCIKQSKIFFYIFTSHQGLKKYSFIHKFSQ